MATNLAIDDFLIEEARSIGGEKTKRAVVTQALMEYIQRRKQQKITELFGTIEYAAGYDYKASRSRRTGAPHAGAR
jgi:Bacterial antitoxin of type II TA system, VapB